LNSAGRHAHEIRLRLADRNGIADLEFPFPQPGLYLGKAEFNTPAVHVKTLRLAWNQAIQRRRKGLFKTEHVSGLYRKVSLFFLEAGTTAKSPPDRRARIIKPGLVFSRAGFFSRNDPPHPSSAII
jgi:hypothetical protein